LSQHTLESLHPPPDPLPEGRGREKKGGKGKEMKERKDVVFRVRLSRSSYEWLKKAAEKEGMSTADLIRDLVLKGVREPEHCRECKQRLSVVMDFRKELNAIGRNLNQIARYVNTMKDKGDAVKVMLLLSEIKGAIEELGARYDREVAE